jgi:hypothetical protein
VIVDKADRMPSAEVDARCDALLGVVDGVLTRIRAATNATVVLHGCCGLPLRKRRELVPLIAPISRGPARALARLNVGLEEMAATGENVVFLDEARIARASGIRRTNKPYLPRRARGGLFHHSALGPLLAAGYVRIVEARQLA